MRKLTLLLATAFCVTNLSAQCHSNFDFQINGFTVSFTSTSSTTQGTIVSYFWDFGDGATSTVQHPAHTFPYPGTYGVKHVATTSLGCRDTVLMIIRIQAPPTLQHVQLCPPSATDSLESIILGYSFQWQVSTDSVNYTDIADGTYYSGTTTSRLKLVNIPSSYSSYRYRCLVDGTHGPKIYRLRFVNNWTGAANNNWSNPANWSCGTVPDSNTDVVVSSGTVTVDANVTVNSLTIAPSAAIVVQAGVTLTVLH